MVSQYLLSQDKERMKKPAPAIAAIGTNKVQLIPSLSLHTSKFPWQPTPSPSRPASFLFLFPVPLFPYSLSIPCTPLFSFFPSGPSPCLLRGDILPILEKWSPWGPYPRTSCVPFEGKEREGDPASDTMNKGISEQERTKRRVGQKKGHAEKRDRERYRQSVARLLFLQLASQCEFMRANICVYMCVCCSERGGPRRSSRLEPRDSDKAPLQFISECPTTTTTNYNNNTPPLLAACTPSFLHAFLPSLHPLRAHPFPPDPDQE
ncbi:MAG: hypothetical protein J3R72DRAFT_461199 [Linnemannia gamsii]|nr:MAG: hypothetical protein J3R72DRAFT_461199 [Linnemannia gamsii]